MEFYLMNIGSEPYIIQVGDRVAQLVVVKEEREKEEWAFEQVEKPDTEPFPLTINENTLVLNDNIQLRSFEKIKIPTGFKVKIPDDSVLFVNISIDLSNQGVYLSNGTGVIDSDYYDADNEGHIYLVIENLNAHSLEIKSGETLATTTVKTFSAPPDDEPKQQKRTGGRGSTGK